MSGLGFVIAMVLIVAMKHAALGFCLCSQTIVLNDCECHASVHPGEDTGGCCSNEDPAPDPRDDCVVLFSLDPGDFLWNAGSEPRPTLTCPALNPAAKGDFSRLAPVAGQRFAPPDARGSPDHGVPLFLRNGVLRL